MTADLSPLVDPVFYEDDRQYAQLVWRRLTGPQRELLLSTYAGFPVKARSDVTGRLIALGLLVADPWFDDTPAAVTEAGRTVVRQR